MFLRTSQPSSDTIPACSKYARTVSGIWFHTSGCAMNRFTTSFMPLLKVPLRSTITWLPTSVTVTPRSSSAVRREASRLIHFSLSTYVMPSYRCSPAWFTIIIYCPAYSSKDTPISAKAASISAVISSSGIGEGITIPSAHSAMLAATVAPSW